MLPKQINWPLLWRTFAFREKIILGALSFLIFSSLLAISVRFYYSNTQIAPARGGTHIEAALGIPRFINPALSQISDTDRDISRLIYSGLTKYTAEGRLIEDLAESYTIESTLYTFKLRKDVLWHDGERLDADDVVFSIKLIQDPKYASPVRLNWQGVGVEKIDDFTVAFKLTSPYSPFLENTTVGILPKHIWENVAPKSFPLAEANLQPIGSGPYKFEKFQKDNSGNIRSYTLEINDKYYDPEGPYIERIVFKFFDSEEESLRAFRSKDVSAMSFASGYNSAQIKDTRGGVIYTFSLPRYFAIFFNQANSDILSDKNVREALLVATNREEIINTAAGGRGQPAFGPIVRELLGYNPQIEEKYKFNLEAAKKILEDNKWIDTDGDGIREKLVSGAERTPLEVNLATVQWPELERVMRAITEQWGQAGVRVNANAYTLGELQQEKIRPRDYEALLFGQVVGIDPDPFSFWHSSQKKDPGLNLALYENKTADKLLEDARQTLDSQTRAEKYVRLQEAISEDIPAIFLYSPDYLYPLNYKLMGISASKIADPSWRFADITDWYMDTKRVWK